MVDAVVSLIDARAFVGAAAGGEAGSAADETARAFDFVAAHLGDGRATAKPEVRPQSGRCVRALILCLQGMFTLKFKAPLLGDG